MWLDSGDGTVDGGGLIEMDPAGIRAGAQQIVNGVLRGADAMGIHFNDIGTPGASYCVCDLWDSSVPGLVDEAGALGAEVIAAFHAWLVSTTDAMARANQLAADQAQATAMTVSVIGGPNAGLGFGGLLAGAIVNDANNRAASVWLDGPAPASQVDLLMAMQNGSVNSGNIGLTLSSMMSDANNEANKVWLAPEGTSYIGGDDYGRDLYKDNQGDVGTLSDIHRDTYDDNHNSSYDYDVD
ncbi:hypothetical protein ISU10_03240 [Nocardioides agariphilus]|jgi:hypothetical protein|uniref:Uncharacterized protein n=1 Tax=Nocardioides agariphilus TaxID=433664 RepID=A0A930VMX0_9ACTN|nr:hypothetical protein [Nocardioides agariphilus]MBF4766780.1 hypothetical protein [Nocardioides agariphilus]